MGGAQGGQGWGREEEAPVGSRVPPSRCSVASRLHGTRGGTERQPRSPSQGSPGHQEDLGDTGQKELTGSFPSLSSSLSCPRLPSGCSLCAPLPAPPPSPLCPAPPRLCPGAQPGQPAAPRGGRPHRHHAPPHQHQVGAGVPQPRAQPRAAPSSRVPGHPPRALRRTQQPRQRLLRDQGPGDGRGTSGPRWACCAQPRSPWLRAPL